jgi:hypothetical protein
MKLRKSSTQHDDMFPATETSPHVHTINNEPLGLLLLCKMASVFAGNTTTGNSEGG